MVWDKTKPETGIAAKTLDDRVRTNNTALETAIDQDHDFTTGGTQTGKHNRVSFIESADIGTGAEGLPILGAQTAGGKAELTFTDEDDNDIQITSAGYLNGNALKADSVDSAAFAAGSIDLEHMSANSVDSDQYVDGSIDIAHLGSDLLVTESDTIASNDDDNTVPTSAAVKDYTDTAIAAIDNTGNFGSWTATDSDSETLTGNHCYKVTSDGFVIVNITNVGDNVESIVLYTDDADDPPTTYQARTTAVAMNIYGDVGSCTLPVKKNHYWEAVPAEAGYTYEIYFLPIGTGECQDQD